LADALYVELAELLKVKLITTDQRLKSSTAAEVISV
jgi:predicted nucleic acid-binding protein